MNSIKELIVNNKSITNLYQIKSYLSKYGLTWILEAEIEHAVLEINKNKRLVWHMGTWNYGTWVYGIWIDGLWQSGNWMNGVWYNGVWKDGTWHNGTWINGVWEEGKRLNGEFKSEPLANL
jgi:hypothetical protein